MEQTLGLVRGALGTLGMGRTPSPQQVNAGAFTYGTAHAHTTPAHGAHPRAAMAGRGVVVPEKGRSAAVTHDSTAPASTIRSSWAKRAKMSLSWRGGPALSLARGAEAPGRHDRVSELQRRRWA